MGSRVLLVDDDANLQMLLAALLIKAGFTVTAAESGSKGLELLAGNDLPDILLLDVQLPDIDGWQTLRRVRSDPRTADLPVVMCTARGLPEDVLRGWSLGCDGYLVKPIDINAVVPALEEVLARDPTERDAVRRASIATLSRAC